MPVVMVILVAPGAALRLLPAQVLLAAKAEDTENPAPIVLKRLSVKALMMASLSEGLVSVMVRMVFGPGPAVAGENTLLTLGTTTVRVAGAAVALEPAEVTSAPTAIVLV